MLGCHRHPNHMVDADLLAMTTFTFRSWKLFFAVTLLIFGADYAGAGSWTGTLQDGSALTVDPGSRRAMRQYNGRSVPLWDGTHRLEDGSVVIVRDGQAVPTEAMMNTWTAEPGAEPRMRERFCDQLVRKACGFKDECARSQPCVLARQLLSMEREQQRRAPVGLGPLPQTESSGECWDALSNASLQACSDSVPEAKDAACKKLVDKVCGATGQCDSSRACEPARQLLKMENEERLESADPDALTPTGAECEKAMDNAFFEPCL